MNEKVRQYSKRSVEICRNCHGVGHVAVPDPPDRGFHEMPLKCDVCNGSGRVDKELDITITIRPHRP